MLSNKLQFQLLSPGWMFFLQFVSFFHKSKLDNGLINEGNKIKSKLSQIQAVKRRSERYQESTIFSFIVTCIFLKIIPNFVDILGKLFHDERPRSEMDLRVEQAANSLLKVSDLTVKAMRAEGFKDVKASD